MIARGGRKGRLRSGSEILLYEDHDPAELGPVIEAARAGDVRALDRLIRLHEKRVLRVLRLLGVPPADREDVAQEVFLRIFRHLEGYRPGRASFGAWVYRISVNAAHDHRGVLSRRRSREASWEEAVAEAEQPGADPSLGLERRDRRRRLEGVLAALSERERAVFVLCEVEGLGSRATAKVLGITSITVRRHLGRARRHLRTLLGEDGEKSPAALNDPDVERVVT